MRNILIVISIALAFASCSKKSTPAETVQPTPQQPVTQKRDTGEKSDLILDKKEIEVQKMEIDRGQLEQLKKALQQQQQLQKVEPVQDNQQQNNGSKNMQVNPSGTKEMDSNKRQP